MVGHHLLGARDVRSLDADLRQPFVNVLHLVIPFVGALLVGRVAREQLGVMLEMRAAAARVRDDSVELFRRKLVDVLSREPLRQLPFTVMRVERAAAVLIVRRDDFAAVLRQHLHRVAIHIAEN